MSDVRNEDLYLPLYHDVDGFRLPVICSAENFRSALSYRPASDDVFVVTYPKCGTTWIQSIVNSIYRNGNSFKSILDYMVCCPFLEMTGEQGVEKMKRPGIIKTHLPFRLHPYSPEAKYIFVARNPKDCCVSFFHHTKNIPFYQYENGNFDDFFELFIDGKTDFGDYFDTLLSWYDHKDDPNVLFLTYENLKKDIKTQVLKIAEFLGSKYLDAMQSSTELLSVVIENSSFNVMREFHNRNFNKITEETNEDLKDNPDIPDAIVAIVKQKIGGVKRPVEFIRKGIVGDWRNYFSESQNKRLEEKFFERLRGTDLLNQWKDCMR